MKEWYKIQPYWKKGAIIGIIIPVGIFLLNLLFDIIAGIKPFREEWSMIFFFLSGSIFGIIIYPFLGIIIGGIVDLIKNKKSIK